MPLGSGLRTGVKHGTDPTTLRPWRPGAGRGLAAHRGRSARTRCWSGRAPARTEPQPLLSTEWIPSQTRDVWEAGQRARRDAVLASHEQHRHARPLTTAGGLAPS